MMRKLKELRVANGLSQQALADQFNLSQQSIYKYENGLAEPDIAMLKQLSQFFGVTIDYLVDDSPMENKEDFPLTLTASEQEVIRNIRKIRPETRQRLIELIRHM